MAFKSRLRLFDPKRPVIVRRPFIANGRRYSPGEEFDWRRLAVEQRRILQMFNSFHLEHEAEEDDAGEPAGAPMSESPEAAFEGFPSPDDEASGDDPEEDESEDDPEESDDESEEIESLTLRMMKQLARERGLPIKKNRADQAEVLREHQRNGGS